jgi:hypothetical protein
MNTRFLVARRLAGRVINRCGLVALTGLLPGGLKAGGEPGVPLLTPGIDRRCASAAGEASGSTGFRAARSVIVVLARVTETRKA